MATLRDIKADINQYDAQTQDYIASLSFVENEIESINSMKRTEGWKIIDAKIRTELKTRINLLIQGDIRIQTLIELLAVADTKQASKELAAAIDAALPEE
jgi:hypothetical protein